MVDGKVRVEVIGVQDIVIQVLKDFINQIGIKFFIKVLIFCFIRVYVIGKGGFIIKVLQEKIGVWIQMFRVEDVFVVVEDEDDDSMIDVLIEGNFQQVVVVCNVILKIVGEWVVNVNICFKGIFVEFFFFIVKNGLISSLEQGKDFQVQVFLYFVWVFYLLEVFQGGQFFVFYFVVDNFIQFIGECDVVRVVKEQIERCVEEFCQ